MEQYDDFWARKPRERQAVRSERAPARPSSTPVAPVDPRPGRRLIAWGVLAALVFPLAGVVIGIVLLFRDRVGPGLGCILLSVLVVLVYYALAG